MTNNELLLIVFLAEDGHVGLHQSKQARDDTRHAVEMARTRCAAEILCQAGHRHNGRLFDSERIDSVVVRCEQYIGADFFQAPGVTFHRAWILVNVLFFAKLRWIDVHGHDHALGVFAREVNKAQVTVVQVAHRRHQCDMVVVMAPAFEQLLQRLFVLNYFHNAFSMVSSVAIMKNSVQVPGNCGP